MPDPFPESGKEPISGNSTPTKSDEYPIEGGKADKVLT